MWAHMARRVLCIEWIDGVKLLGTKIPRFHGHREYECSEVVSFCLQELYGNVPRIRTPRIVWAHTARRVLCMEWIDGVKLTDKEAMAAAGLDIVDFVDVGIECTLWQLLESGLFHADPHP